jgi:flavin-dependent dehydrogenase
MGGLMKADFYDFVIVGAGPAGLTAGINAAKKGFNAIVLEKGKIAGPRPRGESFRENSFLRNLLGDSFFERDCFKMDGGLVFHSPGALKLAHKPGKKPLCFFEWETFIRCLEDQAEDAGVEIQYDAKVLSPVLKNDVCVGVTYKGKDGETARVNGHCVLACDGYQSTLGSYFDVPYDQLNCPMVKCLADNANIDINKTPDLQFYFIGNGDLTDFPDFPPCVVYGFPIGGRRMELGLMLRMGHAHSMKTVTVPDNKTVMKVWNHLKNNYPEFSDYFKGSDIKHEELTGMSNAAMVPDFVPAKGMVLIGDSAGFIDPFGSSGLYSGMAMADFWVSVLAEKLAELAGEAGLVEPVAGLWTDENVTAFKRGFEETSVFKQIKGSYFLIGNFEWYIFKHLRTAVRINRWWPVIQLLLKFA